MYKELVGLTAVRKSSKIKELIDEFRKRMTRITDPIDFVNYTYFLARLHDFDVSNRIESSLKAEFA